MFDRRKPISSRNVDAAYFFSLTDPNRCISVRKELPLEHTAFIVAVWSWVVHSNKYNKIIDTHLTENNKIFIYFDIYTIHYNGYNTMCIALQLDSPSLWNRTANTKVTDFFRTAYSFYPFAFKEFSKAFTGTCIFYSFSAILWLPQVFRGKLIVLQCQNDRIVNMCMVNIDKNDNIG